MTNNQEPRIKNQESRAKTKVMSFFKPETRNPKQHKPETRIYLMYKYESLDSWFL